MEKKLALLDWSYHVCAVGRESTGMLLMYLIVCLFAISSKLKGNRALPQTNFKY